MADTKISAMTAATVINDADVVPIVQSGNKKAAFSLWKSVLKTYFDTLYAAAPLAIATFGFDGGGSVVPAGQITAPRPTPGGFTITGYTIIGDVSGSIVIDVAMATGGSGTFNSITASAKPTLTSQRRVNSTTLTGWTIVVPSGADLKASIVGVPVSVTQCALVIYGTYN